MPQGEATITRCRAQLAAVNIASSLVFWPLLVKMYRVWRIFDNPTLARFVS